MNVLTIQRFNDSTIQRFIHSTPPPPLILPLPRPCLRFQSGMGAQWKQKWRELAADKKGRMTTKLVREIQVAARMGGPNPEFNPRLHAAVEVAKKQSVYKDTIERAIAKGAGLDGKADAFTTVVFEG